uniref:Uncharacterized protein n=1 Tax=Oryza rufipogon TaxID=4529 RepID=A0A0E0NJY6_ORYRU
MIITSSKSGRPGTRGGTVVICRTARSPREAPPLFSQPPHVKLPLYPPRSLSPPLPLSLSPPPLSRSLSQI